MLTRYVLYSCSGKFILYKILFVNYYMHLLFSKK
jgi:hypothetical protein